MGKHCLVSHYIYFHGKVKEQGGRKGIFLLCLSHWFLLPGDVSKALEDHKSRVGINLSVLKAGFFVPKPQQMRRVTVLESYVALSAAYICFSSSLLPKFFLSITIPAHWLTQWLMGPGGSMPHSQGLSNNSYPEPNQPNYPHWYLSLQGPF